MSGANGSGVMFDAIAKRYDTVNRVMSFGIDRRWRRRAVAALELRAGEVALDVATGTGDVALEIVRQYPGVRVFGLDPSAGMLAVAQRKIGAAPIELRQGEAEELPFPDGTFAGVSIAFGIRNVPDRPRALAEMVRVVRPGGRIAVLELSEPRGGVLGPLARFHVHTVVPRIGALLSGADEYRYLQKSIAAFPAPDLFAELMRAAGMVDVVAEPLTFGVCTLFTGEARVTTALGSDLPGARVPGPSIQEARSLLAAGLAAAPAAGLVVVSVAAPLGPLETLLDALPEADALLWDPPEGPRFAGAGVAWRASASGPGRFRELREAAEALWPTLSEPRGGEVPRARLFGGLAFAPGAAREPEWQGFGDGWLSLPRWRYARDGRRAWLSFATDARAARSELRGQALAELDRIWRALAQAEPARPTAAVAGVTQLGQTEWALRIGEIQKAILAGGFEKIVAARRAVVELAGPAQATAVLARLAEAHGCTRFGFRHDGAVFLGATPERLIARHGARISTEALAGSAGGGARGGSDSAAGRGDSASRALLASAKDRGEHGLVVREIVRTLRPLCASLDVPERPIIRQLRHVIHLATPIAGVLAEPVHVLDLVAALHPTPAVGGVPGPDAVRWITDHEEPRGWYAGPIGWVDAAGDGEFAVALRSGLLSGTRAWVFAGAGIVADSDAAAEYAETELKQRALFGALGAP